MSSNAALTVFRWISSKRTSPWNVPMTTGVFALPVDVISPQRVLADCSRPLAHDGAKVRATTTIVEARATTAYVKAAALLAFSQCARKDFNEHLDER